MSKEPGAVHHLGLGGGGDAWYCHDSKGQRVRKVVRRPGGLTEERRYLGALEVFRRTRNGVLLIERQTLHIMDDAHRLAMADTRTAGEDEGPGQLIRYQFSNHLGSASLGLDDQAAVISYEEYYPFGSTSFQSVDGAREVPAKRYRYTGKERDDETGLYDFGYRQYSPWLVRWASPDPIGVSDGLNRYMFVHNNPICFFDGNGLQTQDSKRHPHHGDIVHIFEQGKYSKNVRLGGHSPLEQVSRTPPPVRAESSEAAGPVSIGGPGGPATGTRLPPSSAQPATIAPSTDLDKVTALAGLLNFQSSSGDGVSGGIPGGMGPKENAGEAGQALYSAVSIAGALQFAKSIWTLAKSAVTRVWAVAAARSAGNRALKEAAAEMATKVPTGSAARTGTIKLGLGGTDILRDPNLPVAGVPRIPTNPGYAYHYTNVPEPATAFKDGIRRNTSFTVEGDLSPKNAMARLGIPKPTTVIEVRLRGAESFLPESPYGNLVPSKPSVVLPHYEGQGGAYDFLNPEHIPPEDFAIFEMSRSGPLR